MFSIFQGGHFQGRSPSITPTASAWPASDGDFERRRVVWNPLVNSVMHGAPINGRTQIRNHCDCIGVVISPLWLVPSLQKIYILASSRSHTTLLHFEDDRSLLQNTSVNDSAASLLCNISLLSSLRHSFPSLLCSHTSPTFLSDTLPQHCSATLSSNTPAQRFSKIFCNTSLQHCSPPFLRTTFPHSSQHFYTTLSANISEQHVSSTLFPDTSVQIISRISEGIIHNTSLPQLTMAIQRVRKYFQNYFFFGGGELCFFKDFHWKWRGMRWGWASHPVDSVKKLQIEVIFKKHTKPGFCFWCFLGNYFLVLNGREEVIYRKWASRTYNPSKCSRFETPYIENGHPTLNRESL